MNTTVQITIDSSQQIRVLHNQHCVITDISSLLNNSLGFNNGINKGIWIEHFGVNRFKSLQSFTTLRIENARQTAKKQSKSKSLPCA